VVGVQVLLNHVVDKDVDVDALIEAAKTEQGVRSEAEGDLSVVQGLTGHLYITPEGTQIRAQVPPPTL
jgi:hypothetical protein